MGGRRPEVLADPTPGIRRGVRKFAGGVRPEVLADPTPGNRHQVRKFGGLGGEFDGDDFAATQRFGTQVVAEQDGPLSP